MPDLFSKATTLHCSLVAVPPLTESEIIGEHQIDEVTTNVRSDHASLESAVSEAHVPRNHGYTGVLRLLSDLFPHL
jgi:hypothetical protein